ncbi:hypothetical protein PAMP_011751 [Pampus punctatissimus]
MKFQPHDMGFFKVFLETLTHVCRRFPPPCPSLLPGNQMNLRAHVLFVLADVSILQIFARPFAGRVNHSRLSHTVQCRY